MAALLAQQLDNPKIESLLVAFQEKPTLRYLVSMGVYGVNRRVLSMQQNYPPRPVSGPGPQPPAPTGTPARAVVHVPTGFKAVEIPYHFEDVVLP